jgi:hypothetical protein
MAFSSIVINLPIEVRLGAESFDDMVDTACFVSGSWAEIEEQEDGCSYGFTLRDDGIEFVLTPAKVLEALRKIASPSQELVSSSIADRVRAALAYSATGEYDGAELDFGDTDPVDMDAVIQVALFNEIVYG